MGKHEDCFKEEKKGRVIANVELFVCNAGTPVLVYNDYLVWHPGSKTICEHDGLQPFPSQPAVSKYRMLADRMLRFAQGVDRNCSKSCNCDRAVIAREMREVLGMIERA